MHSMLSLAEKQLTAVGRLRAGEAVAVFAHDFGISGKKLETWGSQVDRAYPSSTATEGPQVVWTHGARPADLPISRWEFE
jgi:hypothetical protein